MTIKETVRRHLAATLAATMKRDRSEPTINLDDWTLDAVERAPAGVPASVILAAASEALEIAIGDEAFFAFLEARVVRDAEGESVRDAEGRRVVTEPFALDLVISVPLGPGDVDNPQWRGPFEDVIGSSFLGDPAAAASVLRALADDLERRAKEDER